MVNKRQEVVPTKRHHLHNFEFKKVQFTHFFRLFMPTHTYTSNKTHTNQFKRQFIQLIYGFCYADINDLNLPKTCTTEFPDPDDLLTFKLIICPDEGFYKGGRFKFSFKVCFIRMTYLFKSCLIISI